VTLLAVPNFSEGRSTETIEAVEEATKTGPARVLDIHSDADHHRTVFTLAGDPGELAPAVVALASAATERIDLRAHDGIHPRVGVLDVAPIVYLTEADRGAACAEALVEADMLSAQLNLPVFLYGILAGGRTRAELRRGGPAALHTRIESGELTPDFGPRTLDLRTGAVLVAARPPLVAFNVELAVPATLEDAKAIAALIRESGAEGLESVRAIGLWLAETNTAQVSTNVEDHRATPLRAIVEAVARHATPTAAELVGLAPRAAFEGFPPDLPVRNKRVIEDFLD
jgi:glutamate formiminotransferase/glutamate formiminotransferase/formiminotetrahydrofolate cyclodeaminase